MTTQTITPRYVDAPREGKKMWQIKTADDKRFGTYESVAKILKGMIGQAVEVEVDQSEYQGRTYYTIKKVVQNQAAPPNGAISQTEGMFVMAVLGKAFEGTGNVPGRTDMASMVTSLVMAWRDSEADLKNIAAQQKPSADPNDEIPF